MKTIRVGNSIYNDSKRVAEFTHGAWYKYKKKAHCTDLEPCDHTEAAQYASMVDALTAPVSEGEILILRTAEGIVKETMVGPGEAKEVLAEVSKGITHGISRHGPYDPATDERDMLERVMRSARNVLVYASMQLVKPGCKNREGLRLIARDAVWMMLKIRKVMR